MLKTASRLVPIAYARGLVAAAALLAAAAVFAADQLEDIISLPYDHKAIQYYERTPTDPVMRLSDRLDKHLVKLDYAAGQTYLPALLKQLDINPDSQVLVFSQTSLQSARISMARPRAVYFNDNVSVGWVQGGDVMELSALDPILGVNFYTMDTHRSDTPFLARREVCLQCHLGAQTLGVPGLMVSSLYPNKPAAAGLHSASYITDHRTPFADRWGGWYITGSMGGQKHLGNAKLDAGPRGDRVDAQGGVDLESLDGRVDMKPYPVPTSDVVALMTLEHQTRMTNLMTRIAWDTRIAQADGKLEASKDKLNGEIEELIGYMLFIDEAPLTAPVQGTSTFTKTFAARGPRDKQGRSLREFDLQTRLFKYPLSYMIYTPAFDAMPEYARERIYRRVYDILTGADTNAKGAHLDSAGREAIIEILRGTKTNLPAYWKPGAK
ncbi:MAG TPA: hypothetical protein VN841_14305 [Bryobacteraceae bacterium]|nr:hypothetical protein [Bryobacteraceae bacterium]